MDCPGSLPLVTLMGAAFGSKTLWVLNPTEMHPCLGEELEGELSRCEGQMVPVQPLKIPCG